MKLLAVKKRVEDGKVRLTAEFLQAGTEEPQEVWFEYGEEWADFVVDHCDPFVPAMLVACMVTGEPLEIEPPVSEKLFDNLRVPIWVQTCWHPELHEVECSAKEVVRRVAPDGRACASFFSCGVDSFYTVLRNREETNPRVSKISHTISMEGFEQPLGKERAPDVRMAAVEKGAREFGLLPIIGASNIRVAFPYNWGFLLHGAVLAGCALSLSAGLHRVHLPASISYVTLNPWGSHPLLEHNYTNEALELPHDGAGTSRTDKIRHAIEWDERVLDHLYVCIGKGDGSKNCGGCKKCVRTLVTLSILGKVERARTFDRIFYPKFEKKHVRKIMKSAYRPMRAERLYCVENYELSKALGHPDPVVQRYLERVIRRTSWSIAYKEVKSLFSSWHVIPGAAGARLPLKSEDYFKEVNKR